MPNALDIPVTGMPVPAPPWRYSERLVTALQAAAVMHAAQERKGDKPNGERIPYLAHLLGTCAIVLEHGGTEAEAIAALLHDAIEDIQPTEATRTAVAWFGDEVLHIVDACTDGVPGPDGHKADWHPRKRAYVAHLAEACAPVLLVSSADKLHNARAIVADQRATGDTVFHSFKKGKDATLWYYRELVTAFRTNPHHHPALVAELDRTVTLMEELARA